MTDVSKIKEHMDVISSNRKVVGKVDHLDGTGKIKLTKHSSPDGQHHHSIPLSWVDHVDQHVHAKSDGRRHHLTLGARSKLTKRPVNSYITAAKPCKLGGQLMGIAKYEIFGKDGAWRIRHEGKGENEYATKEAAFEAAIAAASIALREGHDVTMTALPSETATGAPTK